MWALNVVQGWELLIRIQEALDWNSQEGLAGQDSAELATVRYKFALCTVWLAPLLRVCWL